MFVKFSPIRYDHKISYQFQDEKISIFIDDELWGECDFSEFTEDGMWIDPPFPISSAKRENGVMYVVLRDSERIEYSDWEEVG